VNLVTTTDRLRKLPNDALALVFTNTLSTADAVTAALARRGHATAVLHKRASFDDRKASDLI
jgi:superfamily II DNA/RNA helicase